MKSDSALALAMPSTNGDLEAHPILITDPLTGDQHTPTLASPPDSRTPPTATSLRGHLNGRAMSGAHRAGSEPIDARALSKALKDFEDGPGPREGTPGASPSRKRQRVYGDRFIPNREGQDLQASFSLLHDDASPATPSKTKRRTPHGELHFQKSEKFFLISGLRGKKSADVKQLRKPIVPFPPC